jgi:hypothetical protein
MGLVVLALVDGKELIAAQSFKELPAEAFARPKEDRTRRKVLLALFPAAMYKSIVDNEKSNSQAHESSARRLCPLRRE